MREFHLDDTHSHLRGATPELLSTWNQWAAVGLDQFHTNSEAQFDISVDGTTETIILRWNSSFEKRAMREIRDIAHFGGISLACFYMSTIAGYKTVTQSEIGEGTDYFFSKTDSDDDDLFGQEGIYVEISGIMIGGESDLKSRVKQKHDQIDKGIHGAESCSVIVTCFPISRTVYEAH